MKCQSTFLAISCIVAMFLARTCSSKAVLTFQTDGQSKEHALDETLDHNETLFEEPRQLSLSMNKRVERFPTDHQSSSLNQHSRQKTDTNGRITRIFVG
jgi:hypothetical protein